MDKKVIIYQVLPRLFGNANPRRKHSGTLKENGVGKLSDLDDTRLKSVRDMGFTHIWYTGVIRHATATDYTGFGIPCQHASVVKGLAGSPYAITDYYDVDPDLADNVSHRMEEFESLVKRTHRLGMKVIIDFVPNHVAREYQSIGHPEGVDDLGEKDDTTKHFFAQNNFYYCPGQTFIPPVSPRKGEEPYIERPAKCTGNDRFDNRPTVNDWYETVKLNYGVDYCDAGGRSEHFSPLPDTWRKMVDILLFWATKGVDGFRCDMAEMVPMAFWKYAIDAVKSRYPQIIFIGEVYDANQYRAFVHVGFDYLYDKVGMYDCVRDIICDRRSASSITHYWQNVDDIKDHMLYFLENHDEQRIASEYFCSDAFKAIPAFIVMATLSKGALMVYAGQELGEEGMDSEGFSGKDGRTTIFDYWHIEKLYHGYFDTSRLEEESRLLRRKYQQILRIARTEQAVARGDFFDLMYVNLHSPNLNPRYHYAFMRKHEKDVILVVVNFSDEQSNVGITIPAHAFEVLVLKEGAFKAIDLLAGDTVEVNLQKDGMINMDVKPHCGRIIKFCI